MDKYVNCVTSILEIKKDRERREEGQTHQTKTTSLRTKKDNLISLTSFHILQQKSEFETQHKQSKI